MTTLILQGNCSGVTGRCDANCYNATGRTCTCCCGGANHGVGKRQAEENTQMMAEEMLAAHGVETATKDGDLVLTDGRVIKSRYAGIQPAMIA